MPDADPRALTQETIVDFLKSWRVVLAHKWMITLLVISSVAASVLMTYVVDQEYVSTALVLIRPHERIKLDMNRPGKEVLNYPVSQLAPIDAPSRTYIEVIKSRALAEKVVVTLGLDKKTRTPSDVYWRERWERAKEQMKEFAGDTWIILQHGNLAPVDRLAKAITRVQRHLSLKSTKDTYVFEITASSKDPQEAAAIANASADIFIEYMSDADQKEFQQNRLFLDRQLENAGRGLAEARATLKQFKDTHNTFLLQEEYSAKLKSLGDLEKELAGVEATLSGLMEERTSDHPKVIVLQGKRNRLAHAIRTLERQRDRLPEKEKQFDDLRLQVRVTEENYSAVHKAREEARIQEADRASEIRIVSPAIPAAYPSKPIKIYYAGVALAVAMVLGIVLAFWLEYLNPRIRSMDDVAGLQLRVLATIPLVRFPDRSRWIRRE